MFPRLRRAVLSIVSCAIATCAVASTETVQKPNILFILTDDLGYGDLSCYGATKIKTPNLDKLAAEGCRFTDAHSPASTCTPSRTAFLTGAYAWRNRPGSSIMRGNDQLSIEPGTFTLPAMLKKAGYVTGLIGKWHLGLGGPEGPDWNGEIKPGPRKSALIMPTSSLPPEIAHQPSTSRTIVS